jgi:hypothetical protein
LKKLTAIGIKEEGKPFRMQNAKLFREKLDNLPKGRYLHTVEKYRNKASHPQFAWLYGAVYPLMLIALNDAGYEFTNIDQVDIFCKSMWANKEVLNRETGEVFKIPLSKSEFVTVDHMAYVSNIRAYASEYLSTEIPDPDVNWKQNKDEVN